jgi:hypothetical protein
MVEGVVLATKKALIEIEYDSGYGDGKDLLRNINKKLTGDMVAREVVTGMDPVDPVKGRREGIVTWPAKDRRPVIRSGSKSWRKGTDENSIEFVELTNEEVVMLETRTSD